MASETSNTAPPVSAEAYRLQVILEIYNSIASNLDLYDLLRFALDNSFAYEEIKQLEKQLGRQKLQSAVSAIGCRTVRSISWNPAGTNAHVER